MLTISHNNHRQFGMCEEMKMDFRKDNSQKYHLKFGRAQRKFHDFKTEGIINAKLIGDIATQPIWLSLSGGVDSEFMVRSFLHANINFTPVTMRMWKSHKLVNEYDVHHATEACKNMNIPLKMIDLNLDWFLENELMTYAEGTTCTSPMFPTHMWLWDQLDGFIVAGNGDMNFQRTWETNDWFYKVKETSDSVFRYSIWRDRLGVTGFYTYTPEFMISFVCESEIMKMFMLGQRARVSNERGPKEKLMLRIYPTMKPRYTKHGWEEIMDVDNYYRSQLENYLPKEMVWYQSIDTFIQKIWPECMRHPDGVGGRYLPI